MFVFLSNKIEPIIKHYYTIILTEYILLVFGSLSEYLTKHSNQPQIGKDDKNNQTPN